MLYFSKIYREDLDSVGKKAIELSEISRLGISIPEGFVIPTYFFGKFLKQTGIEEQIKEAQELNHPSISESVDKLFEPIKKQIMHTHIPENLTLELHGFYKKLSGLLKDVSLNISSSSPKNNKSIVFKNVKGDANFILKIKEIWAENINNPVAIIVQKNIASKTKGKTATNNATCELEHIAKKIQKHFYFPKEIDYVIDKNKIYVTGIRPLSEITNEPPISKVLHTITKKIITKGISVNARIVTGAVKLINDYNLNVKKSEIAVMKDLDKKIYNKIKNAKGIVSDNGSHLKNFIKSPAILGTKNATKLLQNGTVVTLNGISGEIYLGGII